MQTGQKIASLRKNAGLNQDELAKKLYVSRELVSKWENGKRNPDYQMLIRISAVFNVAVDELFDSDEKLFDELLECFPENIEISEEQLSKLFDDFLKVLSKTEHTVFISRYYYGQSSKEIAMTLGLRSGNVRKKLTIIRKKLTDFIKENSNG